MNLTKAAWILNYNIESSTIRLSANCRLRQLCTEKLESTINHRRKKNTDPDERTMLAISAIKESKVRSSQIYERYYRLLDKDVAKQFSDLIMSDPAINPSYVAEISPAYGLLTSELLKNARLPKINLFEKMEYFHPDLSLLEAEYPGRVEQKKESFDAVFSPHYSESQDWADRLIELAKGIEKRSWNGKSTVHIIGAVPDALLVSRIIRMALFRLSLAKSGRMVLHLAMPQPAWANLTADNKNYNHYRSWSILFQIFFNYRLLGVLPASGFYPKFTKRHKVINKRKPRNHKNIMYVVRIEAKSVRTLRRKYNLTEEDNVPVFHFVKYHYKKRKNRIIPELEKWIPGCGLTLIAAGYNIVTEFGELLPNEIVKLFLLFKSLPGYKESAFSSMFDSFSPKSDKDPVFDTTIDEVDEMFKASKDATNAQAKMDMSRHRNKSADQPK